MDTVFAIILTVFMLAVIYLDATKYTIPNWLNAALFLCFPAWWLVAPEPIDIMSALTMFGVLFAFGFIIFMLNVMGGGDVKLLSVCGLYTGFTVTGYEMIFLTALLGGVLAVLLLIGRYMMPYVANKVGMKTIPKMFTMGAPVPYGIAIAIAMMFMVWTDRLPGFVVG